MPIINGGRAQPSCRHIYDTHTRLNQQRNCCLTHRLCVFCECCPIGAIRNINGDIYERCQPWSTTTVVSRLNATGRFIASANRRRPRSAARRRTNGYNSSRYVLSIDAAAAHFDEVEAHAPLMYGKLVPCIRRRYSMNHEWRERE